MRLLHSKTLKLYEFSHGYASQVPPYAILSHTWTVGKEVSFQDMQDNTSSSKEGYRKIHGCCRVAAADGFEFVWIDTCCIDKTSSSELSEAINSMFRWYQDAEVCYVYLSDVSSDANLLDPRSLFGGDWFNRGWTLQELIAPSTVIFLGNDWRELGTKSSLQVFISEITGINGDILLGGDLGSVSIAQRMSWASRRRTTRLEDTAYSLMGIFDVNMPMLYGEGERAFIRLQEEIMKDSDDQSIFAWISHRVGDQGGGLLASSPAAFADSGNIICKGNGDTTVPNIYSQPFTVTNRGIHLQLPLVSPSFTGREEYIGVLHCKDLRTPDKQLGILLSKVLGTETGFERTLSHILSITDFGLKPRDIHSIHVRQGRLMRVNRPSPYAQCLINLDTFRSLGFLLKDAFPDYMMQPDGKILFRLSPYDEKLGGLIFHDDLGFRFILIFKMNFRRCCVNFVTDMGNETLEEILGSFRNVNGRVQKREWVEEADRIWRLHPSKGALCLAVRRQIASGCKQLVIDMSCKI